MCRRKMTLKQNAPASSVRIPGHSPWRNDLLRRSFCFYVFSSLVDDPSQCYRDGASALDVWSGDGDHEVHRCSGSVYNAPASIGERELEVCEPRSSLDGIRQINASA